MKKISFEELLALFDESVHRQLREVFSLPITTGMVVFENQQMDSSRFGERTAVIVGPECTYKTVQECEGRHLHDLPSQRQYATYYTEKEDAPEHSQS